MFNKEHTRCPRSPDPTPREIRERAAAIRATWPERRLRENEQHREPQTPVVRAGDLELEPDFRSI